MAVKRFSNSLISQSGQDKVNNFIAGYSPAIDEMDLIERVIVGSGGTSTITFSNIPQRYQHLQVRLTARSTFATTITSFFIRFNGDSGTNYTYHALYGNGSSALSYGAANQAQGAAATFSGSSALADVFGASIIDIIDYTNLSKTKVLRAIGGIDNNGSGEITMASAFWNNMSAITQIVLFPQQGNFTQNSVASLYGVVG